MSFQWRQKIATDVQFVACEGGRFQIVDAATEIDRPSIAVRARGKQVE